MKRIVFLLTCFLSVQILFAQTTFISKGKIEFERTTNVWAEMKGSFAEQMKKASPQYQKSYFNYEFDGNKSIYQPGRESDTKVIAFFRSPATDNEVYSDYATRKSVARKNVFEKSFLI
ncbi:MAG: GLPGLI family protein, partial [Ginsengibacter sp.]